MVNLICELQTGWKSADLWFVDSHVAMHYSSGGYVCQCVCVAAAALCTPVGLCFIVTLTQTLLARRLHATWDRWRIPDCCAGETVQMNAPCGGKCWEWGRGGVMCINVLLHVCAVAGHISNIQLLTHWERENSSWEWRLSWIFQHNQADRNNCKKQQRGGKEVTEIPPCPQNQTPDLLFYLQEFWCQH